jgi:phosphatidate cytidylyltransferase
MADSRSTLLKRVISALLAAAVLFGTGYFGGRMGLYIISTAMIVLGIREYTRMAFLHWKMPASVSWLYWFVCISFYASMVDYFDYGLLSFALSNVAFFIGCLWLTRDRATNDHLLPALAVGTFGLLYCVLFPNFAIQIIKLDDGLQWFLFLMLIVLAGDTFAYFGGRFFGKHKLMPAISPNKTVEGGVVGLIGSSLVGVAHNSLVFPHVPVMSTIAFCILCGFAAQSGDLLMSLVKRVADVKDSGGIMPGHGGVLDRLDGVFIACPLVYGFALYVTARFGA